MTMAESQSQRVQAGARSGMLARLSGALEVGYAAPAERRVAPVGAHILAPVPAALALGGGARRDFHGDFRAAFLHCGTRGDEDELEVVAERAQQLEVGARGPDHD